MKNVIAINCTVNTEASNKSKPKPDHQLSYLPDEKRTFALNLIKEWKAKSRHLTGIDIKTVDSHYKNFERLLRVVKVAPWELKPDHVIHFFDSKVDPVTNVGMGAQTASCYLSAWRSFQAFLLEPDRVNEISQRFNIRPMPFVNEENNITIKRAKNNKSLKGWALSEKQINIIDEQFKILITEAFHKRCKSLIPLQRDRVMFHLCIHFALRVSELITLKVSDFHAHHDRRMAHFGDFGLLTVTGKGNVTGTVPMREPDVHQLLSWYINSVRPMILKRISDNAKKGKSKTADLKPVTLKEGYCEYDGGRYLVSDLLFPSERGGVVSDNTFRARLTKTVENCLKTPRKLTPHTLRHTGCTLMVPIYSPEVAQKYMRHKNLYTTLGYYHPVPLEAADEANRAFYLFDDEED